MKRDNPQPLLSRFLRGTLSVGLGTFSTMFFGLAGTMVIARSLPASDFGIFVLLQVIAAFLVRVTSLGLDLSVPRFVANTDDEERKRQVVGTALGLRVLVIVAVVIASFFAQPALLMLFGATGLMGYFGYIPLLYSMQSIGMLLVASLNGFFRFRSVAIVAFFASVTNFGSILLLVVTLRLDVLGLVYAKLLSAGLANVLAFLSIPVVRGMHFSSEVAKRILRFGWPLQANDILTFVFMRLDTFVIGALMGTAEIAYYEIARKIPESLNGIYEAFRAVYFPFVSRLHGLSQMSKLAEVLNNSTRVISFFTIFGALIALLYGETIITLLFSEQYLPSVPVFVLLMVGLNLTVIEYTLGYSLVAIGESDKPLIINIIRTIVNLVANLTLIPVLGTKGAALANIAANTLTGPLDVFFLRGKSVAAEILVWFKPIIIFMVCGSVFLFLKSSMWLYKPSVLVAFLGISGLFSVITRKDIVTILGEAKNIISRASGRIGWEASP
jgi:O-antigen/teichoic acid export membrane protein